MFNRKGTVPRAVRNFGILIIEVFFKLGNLVKQTEKANPMLVSSLGTMRIIWLRIKPVTKVEGGVVFFSECDGNCLSFYCGGVGTKCKMSYLPEPR